MWGTAPESYFHEFLPNSEHSGLIVTGNPRLDFVKFNPELKTFVNEQKTIGFIGRYHMINRYNAVPAIFSMQHIDKRPILLWQVENFFSTISLLRSVIEKTTANVSIRPHPLEAPEGYSFLREGIFKDRVEIDESLDVAHWTARQRVIVAPSSQSFYEAYVLETPIINIDGLTQQGDVIRGINPNASLSQEISYVPSSCDEAMDMLKRPLVAKKKNPKIDQHMEDFHGWSATHSAIRLSAYEIAQTANKRSRVKLRLPACALDIWDRLSFKSILKRDYLHTNFNYHKHYHQSPDYYSRISDNIEKKRLIFNSR